MKEISTKICRKKDYTFIIDDDGSLKGIKVEEGNNYREYYAVNPHGYEKKINEDVVYEAVRRLKQDNPEGYQDLMTLILMKVNSKYHRAEREAMFPKAKDFREEEEEICNKIYKQEE